MSSFTSRLIFLCLNCHYFKVGKRKLLNIMCIISEELILKEIFHF